MLYLSIHQVVNNNKQILSWGGMGTKKKLFRMVSMVLLLIMYVMLIRCPCIVAPNRFQISHCWNKWSNMEDVYSAVTEPVQLDKKKNNCVYFIFFLFLFLSSILYHLGGPFFSTNEWKSTATKQPRSSKHCYTKW